MIKAAILTISSTRTKDNDASGKVIQSLLKDKQFEILAYDIGKDEISEIKNKLLHYTDEIQVDLILTTGGTGLGPLDITPEATSQIIEKPVPGISELIRMQGLKKTDRAILSRGISGIRKDTLIINLPGSPKGAKESLEAVISIIPHAIDMLKGRGH